MVHIVGAGPGDPELITVKGRRYLEEADVVIYAGSLVNPALLGVCREDAVIHNSAKMTLEEVLAVIEEAEAAGRMTVRLHTGDPAIYGAIQEQMDAMAKKGIAYDVVPGVSSFLASAAALRQEYTLPGISQTVIITRQAGRTPVPEREQLRVLAAHHRRERQDRLLLHAERKIQIPQADVKVDAQHAPTLHGQAGCDRRADRGFARSALAGYHRQNLCHGPSLLFADTCYSL